MADHAGNYRNLDGHWLDGWTVLTHVAAHTEHIRVGTLVARHPLPDQRCTDDARAAPASPPTDHRGWTVPDRPPRGGKARRLLEHARPLRAERDVGMHEFVVFWPPSDRLTLLEEAAASMTALRA